MKKKLIISLIFAAMTLSLTACGGSADSGSGESGTDGEAAEASAANTDYDAADYVTLGDYLGVEVELSDDYSADDEAFYSYIDGVLSSSAGYEEDPDATEVKEDSIVNLNYEGIKDGVPFDGGTAEDQTIDVAGNCTAGGGGFIDGFTSGLPGTKVGETTEYEVTFPENYGSVDLAGQTVIFRFHINYICKPGITHEQLTDEYVRENLGADSVEAYLNSERETFLQDVNADRESAIKSAVTEKVISNATISGYPEDVIESRLNYYIDSYRSYADDGDVESYISENLGISMDQFKEEIRSQIKETLDTEMVFTAIADKEDIGADDDGYKDYLKSLMDRYGATDEASFYEGYGSTREEGEEYVKGIYRCQQAIELCVEKAVVK